MGVDPPPGELGVHRPLGDVVEGAQPVGRQPGVGGQRRRADAERVDRRRGREPADQVGAGDAAAADRFVDGDGDVRQLPGEPVARVDDAMLDDPGGGAAGVPEQAVEMGHVDDRQARLVGDGMAAVRHVALGRVVPQEQRGDVAPRTPAEPSFGEIQLVGPLEHDHVDVEIP